MTTTNVVVQKVTDLLIWDEMTESQLIFTVDRKDSMVVVNTSGERVEGTRGIIVVENRCGKAGTEEVKKIISALDWTDIISFIFVTNHISQIRNIEEQVVSCIPGHGELYGIDPDYYFSLVPLKSPNRKSIENYILSLKSRCTALAKIKFIMKKVMVTFNWSNLLYEQYVFCFYCEKR